MTEIKIKILYWVSQRVLLWGHDTQHIDTQHNDIQHSNNYAQHSGYWQCCYAGTDVEKMNNI